MIYRRYGTAYQSVDIDFDAKALNDIGFRRNRVSAVKVDEFAGSYSPIKTLELATEAEGSVQYETKQVLLDRLREQLESAVADLPDGGIAVVDNEAGHDYPKTRQDTKNVVEEGENRLHFVYSMSPALRITLYQRAA